MSYDTSYLTDECSATLQYVPFQLSLVFHSSTAITSFYATFYFLEKHIKRSPIHNNFKFLLLLYFFNSYARGAVFVASVFSFLYRVFIFNEKVENLLMNPVIFQCLHLIFAGSLVIDATIKGLLVFERMMATGRCEKYENQKARNSCWTYLGITILFPTSTIYVAYRAADFSQSTCFALFAPQNTEKWINILYLASFSFALLSFVMLRVVILLNRKKLKIHNFKLTTRYQIRENLTCTGLVSSVLITGLSVTIFYGLSMIFFRTTHIQIFMNNRPLFSTVKMFCYPFTLADLVIPIYAGSQMNRIKKSKSSVLSNSLNTSTEQATNEYQNILKKQWE